MIFTLQQLELLDAPTDVKYDNLTSLAADLLSVPTAHVSIADHTGNRIFYKSQFGHPNALVASRELPMTQTYCQHVPLTQAPVIVFDASKDPLLKDTPAQKNGPGAYLGLPVSAPCGKVIGGLCLMQPEPRNWTEEEINIAKKLAACVTDLIELKASLLTSEQLRREQKQFTYSISHDLQSPANTLNLILTEIQHNVKDATANNTDTLMLAAEGLSTLRRMKSHVEAVLKYSRLIDLYADHERIALTPLVDEVLTDMQSDIANSGATINRTELPEVIGNKMQIRALFLNLINNALKYYDPDRAPEVNISADHGEAAGKHRITISDNGIGIAPESHDSVFSLFTRLHLGDQYEGSGVGLALCRRVVENHNGTIAIESDGQNGSSFVFTLLDKNND